MTNFPLTYIPTDLDSLHIYLNGIEQFHATDWVYDEATNTVQPLTAMDTRSGDLLEARYAHNDETVVVLGTISGWVPSNEFTPWLFGSYPNTGADKNVSMVAEIFSDEPTYDTPAEPIALSIRLTTELPPDLTSPDNTYWISGYVSAYATWRGLADYWSDPNPYYGPEILISSIAGSFSVPQFDYTVDPENNVNYSGYRFDRVEVAVATAGGPNITYDQVRNWYPVGHPARPS